jgi:hypothetical protein
MNDAPPTAAHHVVVGHDNATRDMTPKSTTCAEAHCDGSPIRSTVSPSVERLTRSKHVVTDGHAKEEARSCSRVQTPAHDRTAY